jgi:transcriptional regulator with XRE-family HTH domain
MAKDWEADFYESLGASMRRQRERLGVTQLELAEALSLSRASIANLEAGRQRLAAHQLFALAQALDIEVLDLVVDVPTVARVPSDDPIRRQHAELRYGMIQAAEGARS